MIRLYAWYVSWSDSAMPLWRARRLLLLGSAGQGVTEYVLVLSLIAVLAIGVCLFLGGQVSTSLSTVGAQFGSPSLGGSAPYPTASP